MTMPLSPFAQNMLRVLVAILVGLPILMILGIQVIMLHQQQTIIQQVESNKAEADATKVAIPKVEKKIEVKVEEAKEVVDSKTKEIKQDRDTYWKEFKKLNPDLSYPPDPVP